MTPEGNGEQTSGQTSSEEAATRFLRDSILLVMGISTARLFRIHGLQSVSARFGLSPCTGVVGNLTKEIMPFRQRGHGIDPGGPTISDGVLLVEQR